MSSSIVKTDTAQLDELGLPGLEHFAGTIHEEFLRSMQGRVGREVYREMANNDAVIGAMLYAIEMLIKQVDWQVLPADDSAEAAADAQFVREVVGDMSHTWEEFVAEWMAAPVYGFAPFEIVWKTRNGYNRDLDKSSDFTDGKVGLAKLAIRHPDTLDSWMFDEEKRNVTGMVQRPAPTYERIEIPIHKLLIFTVLQRKGSPEGTSLLRRAYLSWYRKKRIEEIESIGIERELAGLPMFTTPAQWWATDATPAQKSLLTEVKEIGKRVRQDEQACIVIPAMYDAEGNQLLKFELISTGGTRAIETGPAKEYFSRQAAMVVLMDMLLMGHEKVGSFALADSKTNLFSAGLGGLLSSIGNTINNELLPRLMLVNGRDPANTPTYLHGDIETPNLKELGEYIARLAGSGMAIFPTDDGELERALMHAASLPEDFVDGMRTRMEEDRERGVANEAKPFTDREQTGEKPEEDDLQ